MQGKVLFVAVVLASFAVIALAQHHQPQHSQPPHHQGAPGQMAPPQQHHPVPPAVVGGPRKFTCVFFPGIGNDWPALDIPEEQRASHPSFLRRDYDDMWGKDLKTKLHPHKCEDLFFYDTDTSYRAWDDASLAREYERVLDQRKPHVVFAHGFSNLVLAHCKHLKLKGCLNIGKKVEWFGIAAPLRGTEAPNVMPALCPRLVQHKAFSGGSDCVELPGTHPTKYELSGAWQSLEPSKVPRWVYKIGENDMSGSMCGVAATDYTQAMQTADSTAFGMIAKALSTYHPKGLTSQNARHRPDPEDWKARNIRTNPQVPKVGNDGIVTLSSCSIRAMKKYKKDPAHKYYALDGNHDYSTCSKGDDVHNPGRQPNQWVVRMVDRVRKANKFPPRFAQAHEDESEHETESEEDEQEQEQEEAAEAAADAEEEALVHELDADAMEEDAEDAAEDAAEDQDEAEDEAAADEAEEAAETDEMVAEALEGQAEAAADAEAEAAEEDA